jgi:hypothetical protein
MNDWQPEELQETFSEIARRASVDREFRALALKNAAAAVAQINPKPLPDNIAVQFVDNSGPTKIVPLPDLAPGISEESIEAAEISPANMIFIGFAPNDTPVAHRREEPEAALAES